MLAVRIPIPWYSQINILLIISSYPDDVNGTVLVAEAEGSLRVEVDNQSFRGAVPSNIQYINCAKGQRRVANMQANNYNPIAQYINTTLWIVNYLPY